MDAPAPAVVAVVVTRDPGPWLEETLAALANQDYSELSLLVFVSGGHEDPTPRVARVAPDAFVRRFEEPAGFAETANHVLEMVEGESFFLFCWDDCALDPQGLHILVEESFRSNAGIVSPKMVSWDDPRTLVHVGRNADKTGAVGERVRRDELDQGQHDNVREVFVAPSGCTLVRSDLFRQLRGFDPVIDGVGEDLDLCWRAWVAGALVVAAPDARARVLEASVGGLSPTPTSDGSPLLSPQELQRRYELRDVLKCYSGLHLLRVLPQMVLLGLGEVVIALAVRDRQRARSIVGAWRWNFNNRRELLRARTRLQRMRSVPDSEVRKQQTRGSVRLATYWSSVTHFGVDMAHGRLSSLAAGEEAADLELEEAVEDPELTSSLGGAFSEDDDFDELDDLGRRRRRSHKPERILATRRSRLIAALVTTLVLLIGARDLIGGAFPLVGQFLQPLSWASDWNRFFAGWQPAGLGTTAPASPAFGVLGVIGTFLLGGMGLAQKILVLGCVPIGAWGVSRLLRPIGSRRASLVAAVAYLGLPLPYDALAHGRWDGLVAYAATPWLISRLARATRLPPFDAVEGSRPWSRSLRGQMLSLGVLEAVAVAFAPSMAIVVIIASLAIAVSSIVLGRGSGSLGRRGSRTVSGRVVVVAVGATGVTLGLCVPWVVGTLLSGSKVLGVFGLPQSHTSPLSWGSLLRFDLGPTGGSPLSWLPVLAALLPLLIAASFRFAWAARLWAVAVASWLLAWVVGRGWGGSFAPSVDVILVPAAVAVAACIGLGVSAFETDLVGHRFGWRQLVTALMVSAAVVGLLPVLAEAGNGRFGLPSTGLDTPLQFLGSPGGTGAYRVLWLGAPQALPLGGWSSEPGLAYATSDGLPDATYLFAPAGPGPASTLATDVSLAQQGRTVHLGRLLAPASIRYVVVLGTLAPSITGLQSPANYPLPPGLLTALSDQTDLRQVPGGEGFSVFDNTDFIPQRAERSSAQPLPASGTLNPSASEVTGWHQIMTGQSSALSFSGTIAGGSVFTSYAPAGEWKLISKGTTLSARRAFGWAAQYRNVPAGTAQLAFDGTPLVPVGMLLELALWLFVAWVMLIRRFGIDRWVRERRRRTSV